MEKNDFSACPAMDQAMIDIDIYGDYFYILNDFSRPMRHK